MAVAAAVVAAAMTVAANDVATELVPFPNPFADRHRAHQLGLLHALLRDEGPATATDRIQKVPCQVGNKGIPANGRDQVGSKKCFHF